MKKYQIIYADPPWSYRDKMKGHSFSLDHEYQTQPLDWIKKLPVKEIAEKDCVLFLWAVSPQLPEALEVIKSWGFKYKTLGFLVEMLQYSSCLFWNEYPISLNITVEVNGDINGDIKWLSVEGTG